MIGLPAELLTMVKSFLSNKDLYEINLACRFFQFSCVSRTERRLRKCKLWNCPRFSNNCNHLSCWKYKTRFIKIDEFFSYNFEIYIKNLVRNFETFTFVFNHYKSIMDYDHILSEVFLHACRYGKLSVVQYICNTYDLNRDAVLSERGLSVKWACYGGQFEIVQYIFDTFGFTKNDIPFDVRTDMGALAGACNSGNLLLVKYLCENINLNVNDVRSDRAISNAAFVGHFSVIKYLCETYNLNAEDIAIDGVCLASQNGHLTIVQYLCERYPAMENEGGPIRTSALRAATNGHLEVYLYLRDKFDENVPLNRETMDLNFIFRTVCCRGYMNVVQHFASYVEPTKGAEAIPDASGNGHLEVVIFLCTNFSPTPMDIEKAHLRAVDCGHLTVVKYLSKTYYAFVENALRKNIRCAHGLLKNPFVVMYLCDHFTIEHHDIIFILEKAILRDMDVVKYICTTHFMSSTQLPEHILQFSIENDKYGVFQYLCDNANVSVDHIRYDSLYTLDKVLQTNNLSLMRYICRRFPISIRDICQVTAKMDYSISKNMVQFLVLHFQITTLDEFIDVFFH
jgi:DNA-directed RNA polymerase subunit N (RpoN/RPB10)